MRTHRRSRLATIVAAGLVTTGCPARLEPRAAPAEPIRSPDAGAQRAFESAEAQAQSGDSAGARSALEAFSNSHPGDPLDPVARLDAGRIAFEQRDYAAARADLTPVAGVASSPAGPASAPAAPLQAPPDIVDRARFYLGLSLVHLDDPAGARGMLIPLEPRIAPGDEAVELHAALAEADARLGDVTAALLEYDQFFAGANPAERAYLRARVHALAAGMTHDGALQALGAVQSDGLSAAYLGRRLADEAAAAGDVSAARSFLDRTAAARRNAGLVQAAPDAHADPSIIGVLLPLSGRARAVGEGALRGALLAAGAIVPAVPGAPLPTAPPPTPVTILVRDTGGDSVRAATAVTDLVGAGAIAVIGPIDRGDVAAAATRAESLGMPLLSLAVAQSPVTAGEATPTVLEVLHAPDARGRALADYAVMRAGTRRIAVLYADNDYGRLVEGAFAAEAQKDGATVVAAEPYDAKATSFIKPARAAAQARPDAVFVADSARKVELIAPALALAGLWSVPQGGQAPRGSRPVLLLSTAEGLTSALATAAGRYVQGAVLAPGFFPDDAAPGSGAFVEQYRDTYAGGDPGLFEAAAYAATRAVISAASRGVRTRDDLLGVLMSQSDDVARGGLAELAPAFGPDGTRVDPPALYQVEGDGIRLLVPTP